MERRGVKPQELLAEPNYGWTECIKKGRDRDVEIVSPAQTPKGKLQGKFTLEDFELDIDGQTTQCAAGEQPNVISVAGVRLHVVFARTACEGCPHNGRCPASAVGRGAARYQYTHDRVHLRQRRIAERRDDFRDRYRWRRGRQSNYVAIQIPDGNGSTTNSRYGQRLVYGNAPRTRAEYTTRRRLPIGSWVRQAVCADGRALMRQQNAWMCSVAYRADRLL